MTISLETRTIFHCKCVRPGCGHEWDAFAKPKRCAKCKYLGWNGEDNRRDNPFEGVHYRSRIPTGRTPPQPPSVGEMLKTFVDARAIIDQLIRDYEGSSAHEAKVLADIDSHIERLKRIASGKVAEPVA